MKKVTSIFMEMSVFCFNRVEPAVFLACKRMFIPLSVQFSVHLVLNYEEVSVRCLMNIMKVTIQFN